MKRINKITLVDDDDTFVFLTRKSLERSELVDNIETFCNWQEAIDYIEENINNKKFLPEIILLDLCMPILDGWQFLEQYTKIDKKIQKKISIYIYSSSISPHDIARAKTLNEVTDFIIKPISKEKLIDIVGKHLNSGQKKN